MAPRPYGVSATQVPVPRRAASLWLLGAVALAVAAPASPLGPNIPETRVAALDGHAVTLPGNLPGEATVLILGFGRHSAEATTAWEKPVRTRLANPPGIGFYDMAMLAEVPGFMRSLVVRSIRSKVPEVLHPNFLPLTTDETAWKQVAGFNPDAPDAAYVVVVDRVGKVRWTTHARFTEAGFTQLTQVAQHVASATP